VVFKTTAIDHSAISPCPSFSHTACDGIEAQAFPLALIVLLWWRGDETR
jgi:hypothetical protein